MKNGITVTGMVLSSMPIGEYDRRISLLTKELGKISVFAKGARKPKGAFVACTQSFCFGEFTVFPGKAYTLIGAEIKNYFPEFRENFDYMSRGLYFCEVADYFAQEGQDEGERLKLLYASLKALTAGKMSPSLIKTVFDLRMLVLEGEGPNVFECVACGKKEESDYLYFGNEEGGLLCEDCRLADSLKIRRGTVYAMQYISTAPLEKLYSFTLEEERARELSDVVKQFCSAHVERRFKAEELYSV